MYMQGLLFPSNSDLVGTQEAGLVVCILHMYYL